MSPKQKTIDDKIDDLAIAVKHGFDEVSARFDGVDKELHGVKDRLDIVEMKIDRILERQFDKHEHWIHQIAEKVGIRLVS